MQNPTKIVDNIVKTRCGGNVERCHTIPHLGSYSNAKHSWGVAMLMLQIWPNDFPRLAAHCLTHDVAEAWVGDIPAPLLWAVGSIKLAVDILENQLLEDAGCPRNDTLSKSDLEKLKACDRLELFIWCKEQLNMGNNYARDCYRALRIYFEKNPLPEEAMAVYKQLFHDEMIPTQQGIVSEIVARHERP